MRQGPELSHNTVNPALSGERSDVKALTTSAGVTIVILATLGPKDPMGPVTLLTVAAHVPEIPV
jgi:hypothetical protein